MESGSPSESGSRSDSASVRLASDSALAHPVTGSASGSDCHSDSDSVSALASEYDSASDSALAPGLRSASRLAMVSDSASSSDSQLETHSAPHSDCLRQCRSPPGCVDFAVLAQRLALERTNISAPRVLPRPALASTEYHSCVLATTRSAAEYSDPRHSLEVQRPYNRPKSKPQCGPSCHQQS